MTSQAAEGKILTSAAGGGVRWHPGERLEYLFEERCDASGGENELAVDGPCGRLTYRELDARANRLARFLAGRLGIRPGDRVGLLFDEAVDGYVGMLAVLKAHAVYVPLDPGFPPDRLSYIVSDAAARAVLSHSRLAGLVRAAQENLREEDGARADGCRAVFLDEARDQVAAQASSRLGPDEAGEPDDGLCYVIYTSGTTGRPKGVAVSHPSVCNFVRVAAGTYGITAGDRVYQGLTIAFDFAIEEIWVPWLAGATLVPKPRGGSLLASELSGFLLEAHVTALCCVPTLLATLDADLPELRFLLVSGEPCPQELAARWHRPGRRFLNVYGPTEATVSATWKLLRPGRPVTIGVPLPTYSVAVLDLAEERVLPPGETGEIGIGGIGLADGYLNQPGRTESVFVPDFAGLPDNPSGRIYRTGDLGRINDEGELEHHGRIDTQVKVRGYRIELTEVESVLAEAGGIAQAVVTVHEPEPGITELAAYYRPRHGAGPVDRDSVYAHLRGRLPGYMIPAYLEELAVIPVTVGGKADRKRLPPPSGQRRQSVSGVYAEPAAGAETVLAGTLAGVLGCERVSADADFFDELGASSLLMARFIAGLPDGTTASIRDVYQNRTVRRLAAAIGTRAAGEDGGRPGEPAAPVPADPVPSGPLDLGAPAGAPRFLLCGALQLLAFACLLCLASLVLDDGASWIAAGRGAGAVVARAVVFGAAVQAGLVALPIAAKWLLIGRLRPGRISVWSLAYVRFWIVKTLVIASPPARLGRGSALYNLYLRALGARIGRGAVLFTEHVPVCADLLTVGPGTVVRKNCYLNGYRVRGGVIEFAPVTLGADVFVGEQTVLDIGTAMADGAQLGHSSSLHAGQTVPAGACWHGSPARPAGDGCDYRTGGSARCGPARRAWHAGVRAGFALLVAGPVEAAAGVLLLAGPPVVRDRPEQDALIAAAAGYCGLLVVGLLVAGTVPRLLSRLLEPGRAYPLYGFHYTVQRMVSRLSNITPLHALFGDSVAITGYLRWLGYRLGNVEQTGSNFGMALRHEVPALSEVGRGTMVSDGLSLINADFSSSSFLVRAVAVGERNFLGNNVAFPAGARLGANCLVATKAMVPLTGPVRQDVGLLGSPCFEIPRTVRRDRELAGPVAGGPPRRRLIARKTRHNLVTMGLHVLLRLALLAGLIAVALAPFGDSGAGWQGWAGVVGKAVADLAITIAACTLAERAVTGFRPLVPRSCSIYDRQFWRHERYWKVPWAMYLRLFDGTAAKPALWRLLGVRMGRRVFDDGCGIVERTLTSVGDRAALNMASVLQGHSLEDGMFKSDRIGIGPGCTLGTGAFVHYAVTTGEGSLVEADSFAMKGSFIPPGARWLGNPASAAAAAAAPDDQERK